MASTRLRTLKDVAAFRVDDVDRLHSATHEEIRMGATTDIYFVKTFEILKSLGLENARVVAEIFASRRGVVAGIVECLSLLKDSDVEVWSLQEGDEFVEKEVIMRIAGAYGDFGIYETALLGILASASAWATAARDCLKASGGKTFLAFGARHVHPAVAPVMERAAVIGGASGASDILGARLVGQEPSGTMPHAVVLIVGDTVEVAVQYDKVMPPETKRIVLVDTFKDEVEEALRVAGRLGSRLDGVRLDTPGERGGVTPELVQEARARLDQAGFNHVKIFVSGGVTPERMAVLSLAGADAFGIGSYISAARPIDMTMDLKEVSGKAIAKRGRIPGITPTQRLRKML